MSTPLACETVTVTLERTEIVRGVSFSVSAGEWVSIIGPNGAGKSTLLRAIAGLTRFGGVIDLFGVPTKTTSNRARATQLALVPQTQTVPAGMSVLDYVLLGRNPWIAPLGRESSADIDIAFVCLEQLDAADLHRRSVESLSGGERQRVIIARALAQQAPLLLLDEPTTSLDIGHQQELLELLDRLRRSQDLTLVTTMHDLSLAGHYADRLLLMNHGEVVAHGPPAEVLTPAIIEKYYRASVRILTEDDGTIFVVPMKPTNGASP